MAKYIKPKYKIGDIVVYRNTNCLKGSTQSRIQSKIISAYSLFEDVEGDQDSWYYTTEQTEADNLNEIYENEIIDKLN